MEKITLGIVGGGQLGRMSALAAAQLGIECIIFTPEENSPAETVSKKTIIADYDNETALEEFANRVDVITYEFENIPVDAVKHLKKFKPVYPDENLLNVAQDRISEKSFLNEIGIDTARWAEPKSADDLTSILREWNTKQCILKTARFGYDGKGQARIKKPTDIETTWIEFRGQKIIAEEIVDFECEISVIIARDAEGECVTYGPCLNEHKNHILDKTLLPAPISDDVATKAIHMTEQLAHHINLQGVLALELFVTKDGRILANEIAPRTHNSGHWSIDACITSQFENHVRAVCGLPVLDPQRLSPCTMINLIGKDVESLENYLENPRASVHLYGKDDVRHGRKMGHVTILEIDE